MRALIVDDSSATRRFVGEMLLELGFVTREAADGEQGLDLLEQDADFDVVLIDWNMPRMDGLELIRAIRGRQGLKHLRLVMVTTEASLESVRHAVAAGADEYIMKPFTGQVLEEKLNLIGLTAVGRG